VNGQDVAATLRKIAALRSLLVRLPHLETPVEAERLRRFDTLVRSPRSARIRDIDALAAGWARWWRTGQTRQLLAMAESLPEGLVALDRRLAMYREAARAGTGPD